MIRAYEFSFFGHLEYLGTTQVQATGTLIKSFLTTNWSGLNGHGVFFRTISSVNTGTELYVSSSCCLMMQPWQRHFAKLMLSGNLFLSWSRLKETKRTDISHSQSRNWINHNDFVPSVFCCTKISLLWECFFLNYLVAIVPCCRNVS